MSSDVTSFQHSPYGAPVGSIASAARQLASLASSPKVPTEDAPIMDAIRDAMASGPAIAVASLLCARLIMPAAEDKERPKVVLDVCRRLC